MAWLSRWFRTAPPAPLTLEEKIAALEGRPPEVLVSTALGTEEEGLRIAAIQRLPYDERLATLAGLRESTSALPPAIHRAAQQRVAQLLDAGALDFEQFRSGASNELAMLSVSALCSNPTLLPRAFASIRDQALVIRLVTEGPSSRLRQLAAEAIHDPLQLRELLKDARGKDKNVYRILKQKCDDWLAQERQAARREAEIVAICSALERHSQRPHDALFVPTLEHLCSQWSSLGREAPAEIRERAEQAIDRCRRIISLHLQQVATEAAQVAAIASADPQRQSILEDLLKVLSAMYQSEQAPSAADQQAMEQQLARCEQRWSQAARYKPPGEADLRKYERVREAIGELRRLIGELGTVAQQAAVFRAAPGAAPLADEMRNLRRTLSFTALLADKVPAQAVEAAMLLQTWEKARADKLAADALAIRQAGSLIRKAMAAIRDGSTGRAAGLRRAVEEKLREVPAIPIQITRQLQQLDEKLNELLDWKSYAVAPKRAQLISDMEALIGSTDDPNDLAERIKRLQAEWKSISKGAATGSEADWERFHEAAQKAYQPCRDYFEAQARVRQANLERRKELVQSLGSFEAGQDWTTPNWRSVIAAIRESKQRWRQLSPVDRAAAKAVQESFDAVIGRLQSRVDAEYARNLREKKALIARAQRLQAHEDSRKAIDEAKRLQLSWKQVGPVRWDEDRQLWEEFRQHCDAVYQRRQQQYAEYLAELEANKAKAIALCEAVEQIGAKSGAELVGASKSLGDLRAAFEALGEFPRADARALHDRFERAVENCEARVDLERAREREEGWGNLLHAAGYVRAYRMALSEQTQPGERDMLKQAAQSFIDSVQHWPKGGLQAIKNQLAKEEPGDIAANEAALRALCVRAEILTDQPAPPEDQELRRRYQVEQLVRHMGQGSSAAAEQLDLITFEWISVGATRAQVYESLKERFLRCRMHSQGS